MAELTETTWRARATLRCYTCSPDRGDGICFLSGFPRVQRRLGDHQNGEAAAASESCEKPYLVESSDDVTGECGCLLTLTHAMSSSGVHVFLRAGQ